MPCYLHEKNNRYVFYKTDNYSQIKRKVLRPNQSSRHLMDVQRTKKTSGCKTLILFIT